jgi:pimeloyl-ACP methyl ester carboxylesterase
MPTIDRDGCTLHWEVVGHGPATLVLTHGLGVTGETWAKQVASFAPHYRVVTWDLRAHGRSGSSGDLAIDLATLGDDLAAVAAAAGSGAPVHALGHSAGGVVTMRFALDHPALCRSLVLVGTASECNAKAFAWYESLAETATQDGGRAVLRRLGERDLEAVPPDPTGFARIARAMGGLHHAPLTEVLAVVRCPTLVIVGERDFLGVGGSVIISRRIAGAELHVVPDRPHALFHEDPAGFEALVLPFLRRVDSR